MISHLGAMLGVADGIALAHKLKNEQKVSVVFSGDGGGSEGDFDEAEIRQAQDAGFKAVHLGEARLRTETAGIAAVHVLNLIQNSDFARSPEV